VTLPTLHRERLAVPVGGDRFVQPQGGGLVDAPGHESQPSDRRTGDGLVSTATAKETIDLPTVISQYANDDFRAVLDKHRVQPSMSRKGNCWDNTVTDTLFGSLKLERLYGERFETIREAKDAVLVWLLWYNRRRMHSTMNYLSPVEFESHWKIEHLLAAACAM
jgi:hypothetical protein